jgi:maltooligosyltrehalose trehalohydrolase
MIARFGATARADGVTFRVWAPAQQRVVVVLDGHSDVVMERSDDGFFHADVPGLRPGQRYRFGLKQGLRADPASRWQPEGPMGPSEVVASGGFQWSDVDWPGAPQPHEHVIYEMHIGTFTQEGTWSAACARLRPLAELGVTTIEVMPVAEFAGRFGWGYDGVQLYAPSHLYGSPDDVRAFVNTAHALGLAVILDVVYNHFGPVGNFFPEFSDTLEGPPGEWGASLNYDGRGSAAVRAFVQDNASYWISEFHFDGLRLDAVNALQDSSEDHIVGEICAAAREAAGARRVFLVGECEPQDARLLKDTGAFRDGLDAMWNEDWHHSAFVALTGRRHAYFTDYRGTAPEFAAMARHGFLYQGQWYSWQNQRRGGYVLGLPGRRFVSFLENHDQVANTGLGERLYQQVDRALWRAFTALLLLGPALPMLFQGQEFGSSKPFTYFADHDGDLAARVRQGRIDFLAQFPSLKTPEMRAAVPDPSSPETFARCKLDDRERDESDSALWRLHQDLLRLRRGDEVLKDVGSGRVRVESSAPTASVLLIRYLGHADDRLLMINLADEYPCAMNDPLFAPRPGSTWTQLWCSEHLRYGGIAAPSVLETNPWVLPATSAILLGSTPGF